MTRNRDNTTHQNKSIPNSHATKPENKDDIDSRSNEEFETKGDDVTHNKKEKKSDRKKVKND
jgi:hypothetical protein